MRLGLAVLLLLYGFVLVAIAASAPVIFNITIPKSASGFEEEDAYICTTLPLPAQPMKLVGVEPIAKQEIVHHILLFGCSVPHVEPKDGNQPVWDCKRARTCGSFEETILYGWGRNAPKLELPKGVGFSVGGSSSIRYIVAQLHYLSPKPKGDSSGVSLSLQKDPVPYSAGMLSYASWFSIPPRKKEHLVINRCCYRGFQPLSTFAVRVHTHGMGRSVFMVRQRVNATLAPKNALDVIAKGDPLAPQGFNPVKRSVIYPGDSLTVTCAFESTNVTHWVSAGPSHDHEMCNMYLMVYSAIPHIEMCNDGEGMAADTQPGSMPHSALVTPDPFPGWRPPKPSDKVKAASGAQGVLGDVTSLTLAPDGTLWALHRGGATWDQNTFDPATNKLRDPKPIAVDVVVQMDADTGKVLRRWGAGVFYMPHMISVDYDGNVWVTDVGRHQVLKFSPAGKLLMEVGRKLEPGSGKDRLCKPTQVAFLRDASFIVSDGYCNSRAVRFSASGAFKSEGGGAAGRMSVVHSVLADECGKRLYLADREGARVVVLDLDTYSLIQSIDLSRYGRVWALQAGPYGRVLALAWEEGRNATLAEVAPFDSAAPVSWQLPATAALWPHDLALGAAPLALSGAGDRLFAVYVAPLCAGCGPARKYVMFPTSYARQAPRLPQASASGKPVLAHFGGHHDDAHAAASPPPTASGAAPDAAAAAADAEKSVEKEAVAGGKEEEERDEKAAQGEDKKEDRKEEHEEEHEKEEEEEEDAEEKEEEEAALKDGISKVVQQLGAQRSRERAAPAAAGAAAAKGGDGKQQEEEDEGDEWEDEDVGTVHETLHSRAAPSRPLWLSAANVLIAAAVFAVITAAVALKLMQREPPRAPAARGGELARLANGGAENGWHGGGGQGDGGGLFGGAEGRGGGGWGGRQGAAADADDLGDGLADGDQDLERLEREMLLRGGARSGPGSSRS